MNDGRGRAMSTTETEKKIIISVDPSLSPEVQEELRKTIEKGFKGAGGYFSVEGTMLGMSFGICSGGLLSLVTEVPSSIGYTMVLGMIGGNLVRVAIPGVRRKIKVGNAAWVAYRANEWRTSDIGWEEGEKLIQRASESIEWITGSLVHRDGQIDTVHNNVVLPRQLWDLMGDLTELQKHRENRPVEGSPLAETHDKVIGQIKVNCERRVLALETYARQVMSADKRYAELVSVEMLESKSSSLMDLLARTSIVDRDVSELNGLTAEATHLVESYRTALAAAREAGLALTSA